MQFMKNVPIMDDLHKDMKTIAVKRGITIQRLADEWLSAALLNAIKTKSPGPAPKEKPSK